MGKGNENGVIVKWYRGTEVQRYRAPEFFPLKPL